MSSKIKVLQVIPKLGYGGAETGCYDLAHYLPEHECKSYIITSGGELLKFINKDKVKVFRLPVHLKNPIIIYLSKLLEKWAYKNSSSIVALSPEMKKGIISKKIASNKVAVIPNSSDLSKLEYNEYLANNFRRSRTWLKNKPLLVYTGAFGKVNDLSYTIELAKELLKINSEIKILLIGDGIEKEQLISAAKKKNVYNINLFFENPLPKKAVVLKIRKYL